MMSMPKLKIVFFGTPEPSCSVLKGLLESDHEVVAVITQPDKRRGRGSSLLPTPVKLLANDHSLEVFTPNNKSELNEVVKNLKADIGIVVAYGRIVSTQVLEAFKYGCINVHYSLLPRWRGAAPVERAILAGDEISGVSIMQMDAGLDTGPVFVDRHIDIEKDTTTESLFNSMNAIAPELLLLVLDSLDSSETTEQQGVETYAHKLDKSDFYFDRSISVVELDRKIRASSYVKGAHTLVNGEVFRITNRVSFDLIDVDSHLVGTISREGILYCHDGELVIDTVQVPGKVEMSFTSFANGVDQSRFPMEIV